MTTSWTQTTNQIVARALRQMGAVATGDTPTANQYADGRDALNALAQSLQNEGIMLWTSDWTTQTLTASSEVTGTDSLNYTCIRKHTAASTDRPITGANYTTYWKQKGSSGSTWVTGTAYTSVNQFALGSSVVDIQNPFVRFNGKDYEIEILDKNKYLAIADKSVTNSIPTQMWIEYQLANINCYLYPQPSDTDAVIHFKKITRLEDFTTNNGIDFPVRWIDSLTKGLAYELAKENGIPVSEREVLKRDYLEAKSIVKINNRETPDYCFVEGAF